MLKNTSPFSIPQNVRGSSVLPEDVHISPSSPQVAPEFKQMYPDDLWEAISDTAPDMDVPPEYKELLNRVFQIEQFRKNQLEVIVESIQGRDVLVLMPTGGGKSLCFQFPAVYQHEKNKAVTIVVSPLIALIRDQVEALEAKKIKAVGITRETPNSEKLIQKLVGNSKPALVYVTPERIQHVNFHRALCHLYNTGKLARFVIDEAHCVSNSDDFRKPVSGTALLLGAFPLTRTASHFLVPTTPFPAAGLPERPHNGSHINSDRQNYSQYRWPFAAKRPY